eukprot:TRINITY_DN1971_c0_g1_i1.p1 TRINITY_DN1971_c0_g1~~TRINITY_DN1971_c0_g1_i1.p1  ORF type:complete len:450 (-),score=93.99 TRINITY_DN1971_c0_g1_i1:5300-6649(-)
MNEILQAARRLAKIEQILGKLQGKSAFSLNELTALAPALLALKNSLDDGQKFTTQSLATTDKNAQSLEQIKNAAKLLYEETSKLLSDLHEVTQADFQALSSEIMAIVSSIGLIDRKVIMDLKKTEEYLAIESLKTATNYVNLCEGNKDYVKACGKTKLKAMQNTVDAGMREIEALNQEAKMGEAGKSPIVNETVGKIVVQYKEHIMVKLRLELEQKMKYLERLKKNQLKEGAKGYVHGLKEDSEVKMARGKLAVMENESERIVDSAIESVNNLEIELGDFEIDYLEKIQAINREEDPIKKETEKRKMFTEVLEFDKKFRDILGKISQEFFEKETDADAASQEIAEIIKEIERSDPENAMVGEIAKGLDHERERIDIKRKAAANSVKGKIVELKKKMKMQMHLAEQYGARAKMAKRDIVKNVVGDDMEVDEEDIQQSYIPKIMSIHLMIE